VRLDEFDEELLFLMDRCGNTLKSSEEGESEKYCERECRRAVIGETIFQV
jgi:hypothetical protein